LSAARADEAIVDCPPQGLIFGLDTVPATASRVVNAMPTCPACSTNVDLQALETVTVGQAAKSILSDWRVWALSFGAFFSTAILLNVMGLAPELAAPGVGAALGAVWALRLGRTRGCPSCKKVVAFDLSGKKS